MNFADHLKRALEIVQLDADAIDATAADETAFANGLGIVALAGVAVGVGTFFLPFGVVVMPVVWLASVFVVAGLLHLLAKLAFRGADEFLAFFRVFANTYILQWVAVIPVLGPMALWWLAAVWQLVVTTYAVERTYGLERSKAVATVGILVGAFLVITTVFGSFALLMALLLAFRS